MVTVNMARGGTPEFKPIHCAGDWASFNGPVTTPQFDGTPPYNSHACGAHGQGWLNMNFPLVPNLQNNDAHKWMRLALKDIQNVGDVFLWGWVPMRGYVLAQHFELTQGDSLLDGVYIKPVAWRRKWDIANRDYIWEEEAAYAAAITAAGISQFPLGTPKDGDTRWAFAKLDDISGGAKAPCTFGHNIPKVDDKGIPTGPLDEFYGAVYLGFEVSEGAANKIAEIWRSNIVFHTSAKISQFECATQIA